MGFITLDRQTQYHQLLKAWHKRRFIPKSAVELWQKTSKAGAVTCWPVGGTPLKPTVDFLFTETGPASGDKGPSNPSTISGVSEIKLTHGAGNIIEFDVMTAGSSVSSIAAGNADGSFTINGTVPSGGGFLYRKNGTYAQNMELNLESYSTFLPAGTYKIGLLIESGTYTQNSGNCYIRYRTTKELGSGEYIDLDRIYSASETSTSGGTITMPDGGGWYTYVIGIGATASFSNCTLRPFLYVDGADISGDVVQANSYYTIDLGSTCYGGSIDLATGVMTVTWVAVELNGTETWEAIGSNYNSGTGIGYTRCYPQDLGLEKKAATDVTLNCACSHFPYDGNFGATSVSDGTVTTPRMYYTNGTDAIHGQARFAVPYSDVSDFKTWLASQKSGGTPVMLTYKIYEPFTVSLTPTQILSLAQADKYTPRLNTIYADASAVQVGYVKSPIREEFELQQAIAATAGGE